MCNTETCHATGCTDDCKECGIGKEEIKLDRLLGRLKQAGVERGARNRIVAEKTGYSEKSVGNILSGNAKLTDRFIRAACSAFNIKYFDVMGCEVKPPLEQSALLAAIFQAIREELPRAISRHSEEKWAALTFREMYFEVQREMNEYLLAEHRGDRDGPHGMIRELYHAQVVIVRILMEMERRGRG